MKKDIVLCGVGGQGILTIAVLAVSAAVKEGLNFRQSEVHGMSQRGGSVECHVRLSDGPVYGDLVGRGRADILIAVEPLEALRYVEYLREGGIIISGTEPFKNIPDYPAVETVLEQLRKTGAKCHLIDAAGLAKQAGNSRAQNVVLAGAAAHFMGLEKELLLDAVRSMFGHKGQAVIDLNLKAFDSGFNAIN